MSDLETTELTPLQTDLKTEYLARNLKDIERVLDRCSEEGLIGEIASRAHWNKPTVVVDVGCGVGTTIEEIARIGHLLMMDRFYVQGRIQAIGIDLNPLPNLIPSSVLSIDPQEGQRTDVVTQPLAEFRKDDVRTLETLPSDSVDVLYSVGCLQYVEDTLRALESGLRVLKPDGFMVFEVPANIISQPDIATIIQSTQGASEVFSIPSRPSYHSDYRDDNPFIVGRKKSNNKFQGFPWRLIGSRVLGSVQHYQPHYKHVVTGIYEPIETDIRFSR